MRFCSVCRAAFRTDDLTRCLRDGAELTEGPDPLLGSVIAGRYRILSLLGNGGMGQVYHAEHVEIGKEFALKILYGDLAAKDKMLARFRREARAASLLKHIHIISVTDFGSTEQGLAYLAMELLSGCSLAQLVEKEGPLSFGRAVHITKQIALALAHAHDKGILHRDLKPENVMIEDREEGADFVTVLDFGLARIVQSKLQSELEPLTAIGTVQGTPEFMSPEQCQALSLGPPSDLYSLGLLLYYMLSRQLPFDPPAQRAEMLSLHAFEPPRPLSQLVRVPAPLEAVVMRLLEKEPEKRYPSGRDVALALDDALAAAEQNRQRSPSDTWDDTAEQTFPDDRVENAVSDETQQIPLVAETSLVLPSGLSLPTLDLLVEEREDSALDGPSTSREKSEFFAEGGTISQSALTEKLSVLSDPPSSKHNAPLSGPSWAEHTPLQSPEDTQALAAYHKKLPTWALWASVGAGSLGVAALLYAIFLWVQG